MTEKEGALCVSKREHVRGELEGEQKRGREGERPHLCSP